MTPNFFPLFFVVWYVYKTTLVFKREKDDSRDILTAFKDRRRFLDISNYEKQKKKISCHMHFKIRGWLNLRCKHFLCARVKWGGAISLSFTARPTREKFVKAIVKSKLLQTYDFSCFFHCSHFLHIINMLLIYQAFSSEQVFWRVLSVWKLEVMSLPVLSDNLTRTRRNYSVAELWFTVGLKFIALILSVPCLLLLVLSNRCANTMKHWQIF